MSVRDMNLRPSNLLFAAALVSVCLAATGASAQRATSKPKMGKVLMPIGDATEAMDTLYPFFRLAE